MSKSTGAFWASCDSLHHWIHHSSTYLPREQIRASNSNEPLGNPHPRPGPPFALGEKASHGGPHCAAAVAGDLDWSYGTRGRWWSLCYLSEIISIYFSLFPSSFGRWLTGTALDRPILQMRKSLVGFGKSLVRHRVPTAWQMLQDTSGDPCFYADSTVLLRPSWLMVMLSIQCPRINRILNCLNDWFSKVFKESTLIHT